jgi:hypothetical protein
MRTICSAAIALSAPGRFSTITGCPNCSERLARDARGRVGEPPGGKPTMSRMVSRIGCAIADVGQHQDETYLFMGFFRHAS